MPSFIPAIRLVADPYHNSFTALDLGDKMKDIQGVYASGMAGCRGPPRAMLMLPREMGCSAFPTCLEVLLCFLLHLLALAHPVLSLHFAVSLFNRHHSRVIMHFRSPSGPCSVCSRASRSSNCRSPPLYYRRIADMLSAPRSEL